MAFHENHSTQAYPDNRSPYLGAAAQQPHAPDWRDRGDFVGLGSQETNTDLLSHYSFPPAGDGERSASQRTEGGEEGGDGCERVLVRCPDVASPHHAPAMDGERVLMRGTSPGVTKKMCLPWTGIAS